MRRPPFTVDATTDLAPLERRLEERLARCRLVRRVRLLSEVDSTNRVALEGLSAGEPEGLLVWAERQSEGRGRRGRRWLGAPRRGIAASLLLRPRAPLETCSYLSLLAAHALCAELRSTAGIPAGIRWPNDVVARGRKLSGLLLEAGPGGLVLGIGLNVNQRSGDLPAELRDAATSARVETGRTWDRARLLGGFLERFERNYREFLSRGPGVRLRELNRWSVLRDREVVVSLGGRDLAGVAGSIAPDGALELRCGGGRVRKLHAGEVVRVADPGSQEEG
jgi:BirA family biotin operon repressor/biotin-[acetyl-CoA-carboxylase] ligase